MDRRILFFFLALFLAFESSSFAGTIQLPKTSQTSGSDTYSYRVFLSTVIGPPDALAIIGPSGGTVQVNNPSSHLYGVKIEIPAGAVDGNVTISVKQELGQVPIPPSAVRAGPIVSLNPEGIIFKKPVTLTIPYDPQAPSDTNTLYVYKYNGSSWEGVTFIKRDIVNSTVTVQTMHFSFYTVLSPTSTQHTGVVDTGFKPTKDGFQNANFAYPGNCFGMVSYAKWYFQNERVVYGNLNNAYNFCTDRKVASAAQTSMGKVFGTQTNQEAANQLINDLKATGNPQMLILRENSGGAWEDIGHAVLVYAYDYDNRKFHIYDPNLPGIDFFTIGFDGVSLHYEGFTDFKAAGSDLFDPNAMKTVFLEFTPGISGQWETIDGCVLMLKQTGTTLTGTAECPNECGVWPVTGSYIKPAITWQATNPGVPLCATQAIFNGTMDADEESASGEFTIISSSGNSTDPFDIYKLSPLCDQSAP